MPITPTRYVSGRDALERRLPQLPVDHDGDLPKLLILIRRYYRARSRSGSPSTATRTTRPTRSSASPEKQATLVSLAAMRAWRLPRVAMLIQYLYRGEVALGRFQTGLVTPTAARSRRCGVQLPFAQKARDGDRAVVWGQIRGGPHGRQTYRLEVLHGDRWGPVGQRRDPLTNNDGFSSGRSGSNGDMLRIWAPRQRRFSLQLRVRWRSGARRLGPGERRVEHSRAVAAAVAASTAPASSSPRTRMSVAATPASATNPVSQNAHWRPPAHADVGAAPVYASVFTCADTTVERRDAERAAELL